jgi:hypothetical protein
MIGSMEFPTLMGTNDRRASINPPDEHEEPEVAAVPQQEI